MCILDIPRPEVNENPLTLRCVDSEKIIIITSHNKSIKIQITETTLVGKYLFFKEFIEKLLQAQKNQSYLVYSSVVEIYTRNIQKPYTRANLANMIATFNYNIRNSAKNDSFLSIKIQAITEAKGRNGVALGYELIFHENKNTGHTDTDQNCLSSFQQPKTATKIDDADVYFSDSFWEGFFGTELWLKILEINNNLSSDSKNT